MNSADRPKPYDFLNSWLDRPIRIKLRDGSSLEGIFQSYDVHMNVVVRIQRDLNISYVFIRGDSLLTIEKNEK
ncbi:MAG: LSM domain-containing protein [Candidatus Micrarchaeota archaeon]|nr:LSM domain-containing protein [Candidatus Micrarchaeota archaeon]MCX8154708.1 LSM domain-containing protein [Candidatus Micrarchaeota archaeon]